MTQQSARHIRFKGRSFPALTLEPEAPLDGWIEQLDALLAQSPGFFARKSIVIDAARLELQQPGLVDLVDKLTKRGIRMMGIAGVDMSWASDELPPILASGRLIELPIETANENELAKNGRAENGAIEDALAADALAADELAGGETPGSESATSAANETETTGLTAALGDLASESGESEPAKAAADPKPVADIQPVADDKPRGKPLIIKDHVRSGQSVYNTEGDITIIGSVSSGAEVLAAGSVHIYGTLRGRAMAGAYGEANARIFCRKLEAELISVCGVYLTAEEISPDMQRQPIQAWLENETVKIERLD